MGFFFTNNNHELQTCYSLGSSEDLEKIQKTGTYPRPTKWNMKMEVNSGISIFKKPLNHSDVDWFRNH